MNQKTSLNMNRILSGLDLPPGAVSPPAELTEEEMFSSVYNENVVKRFMHFIVPYKLVVTFSLFAVLIFTCLLYTSDAADE